jgi:hypothetical protein
MAVVHVHHLVPAAAAVEAQRRLALSAAERVLELVAIAPPLRGGDDGLEGEAVQPADPAQGVIDLGALLLELAFIGQSLPRRARARLAAVHTGRGHPVRGGTQELRGRRLRVVSLRLVHARADAIAGQPASDEDHVPVEAGHATPAVRKGIDLELELGATLGSCPARGLLGARGALGRWRHAQ